MPRDHAYFDNALRYIGDSLGLSDLVFDDDNICKLVVEDDLGVTLSRDLARGSLVFCAPVAAELSEEMFVAVGRDLLALALAPLRGAFPSVGFDPETDVVVAYQVQAVTAELKPHEMTSAFTSFVDYALAVQKLFNKAKSHTGKLVPSVINPTDWIHA